MTWGRAYLIAVAIDALVAWDMVGMMTPAFAGEMSPPLTIEKFRAAISQMTADGSVRGDGEGNRYLIRKGRIKRGGPASFWVEVEVAPLPRVGQ